MKSANVSPQKVSSKTELVQRGFSLGRRGIEGNSYLDEPSMASPYFAFNPKVGAEYEKLLNQAEVSKKEAYKLYRLSKA